MAILKQSTARNRMFKMISSTDHFSAKTGAAPTVNLSKNGAAFGAAGGAVSELANGWYQVALNTTDTNTLGDLVFYITGSGADDTDFCDQVSARILDDLLPTASYTAPTNLTGAQIATAVWTDTTAGDFTTALSIGKSVMNGVALGTGLTVNSLTNLPSIPANWITAAGITAGALNGKGDWLLSSSYVAPTNLTAAQIATGVWTDTTAGDFTVAASVGKSVMNGVALGTGLTVAAVSGAVGSVTGAVGSVTGNVGGNVVGSVASVTARVTANTDQLAGQTVTAAAGVTFPSSVASPTNITAGTITTVTNLTNAPTAGDFTAAMKTSLGVSVASGLSTDTYAEPVQGAPAATASLATKIGFLYKAWRNKTTQTATDYSLFNDDAVTIDHKATVSDDGTTFTRTEVASGP